MLYHLLRFAVRLLSYIPFGGLYILSDLLFYPVYYVVRYRRRIVRKNLTETFADKELKDIIRIEKNFYHFLIDMILEACKLMTISPKEMTSHLKFNNIEMVNDLLCQNRSVAVLIGHYGNWEWLSSVGLWNKSDCPIAQIYHRLSNERVNELMLQVRERWGCVCVEMHKTARYVASAEARKEAYGLALIADQSPRKRDAKYYVSFLNHNVPVLLGPEKLIHKYGLECLFLNVRRVKRGYYECELSPLHNDVPSLQEDELSNIYFQRLEEEIMEQPELYLWSHNRFRLARKDRGGSTGTQQQ